VKHVPLFWHDTYICLQYKKGYHGISDIKKKEIDPTSKLWINWHLVFENSFLFVIYICILVISNNFLIFCHPSLLVKFAHLTSSKNTIIYFYKLLFSEHSFLKVKKVCNSVHIRGDGYTFNHDIIYTFFRTVFVYIYLLIWKL
jgi:hypothetical protein